MRNRAQSLADNVKNEKERCRKQQLASGEGVNAKQPDSEEFYVLGGPGQSEMRHANQCITPNEAATWSRSQ